MVSAMVDIKEHTNRVLNIVKAKYGFRTKSQVIDFVVNEYEQEFLEPELRPEYVEKLNRIEKEKGIPFSSIEELRESIEHA